MTQLALARKWRPRDFSALVGQDHVVRALTHALTTGRLHHAYLFTGTRGVGKTTISRILAKALNCERGVGAEPCNACAACQAIDADRFPDYVEMDAASNRGVDEMAALLEQATYAPVAGRYKVYMIDEVHMLSTSAFNALLKTLEEPPPHVKFIFATTEIRKVPVTVLSRCQRFDLRRIEPEVMIALLRRIATAEGAQITDDALALITRAAEGSARDATSLLDQAISHGAGETTAEQVRAMLGLADRGRVIDLFEMILRGDAASALTELQSQYADGADPVAVLRDLAEITHWISVVKITPDAGEDPTIAPDERVRGRELVNKLAMRVLTRLWQMLLKALEEVSAAPNAMMAAEMAIIRLTHVADLPDPEALIRRVQQAQAAGDFARQGVPAAPSQAPRAARPAPVIAQRSGAATALAVSPDAFAAWPDFASVLELIRRMGDMLLLVQVERHVGLVRYSPGRIEFEPKGNAPRDLAQKLAERLRGWTGGQRWVVTVTNDGGAPTIAEQQAAEQREREERALQLPIVQQVLATFPGAKLRDVRRVAPEVEAVEAEGAANPHELTQGPVAEVEEWDPFEDED